MLNNKKLNLFLKKNKEKKVVLCHGVFDVVHIGHLEYLKKAKSFGDILIVSITSKNFVNKGSDRPIFNDKERSKFLKNISFIDYVHVNHDFNSVSLIKKIKPNFYCKGKEYSNFKSDLTENIKKEVNEVRKNGGTFKVIYTKVFSSSSLINKTMNNYNIEQKKNLEISKKDLKNNKINEIKEKLKKKSITIIGEAIIDEYIFSETIGKSGKDPMLVTKKIKSSKYLGGVLSIANIIGSFVKDVTIITYLGKNDSQLPWIKCRLKKNVKLKFIKKNNSPTIYKKRYVDNYFENKIFGSYKINNNFLNPLEEKKVIKYINEIKASNIVCVIDYGHGLFTDKICSNINSLKNSKSLNVQFNSFNQSYQKISKFKNFNLACFNKKEIFYESKKIVNDNEIDNLTKKIATVNNFKKTVVSLGKNGSKMYDKKLNKIHYCPAFAKITKDRIGAGDSLFAFMSILNDLKISNEAALLLGNYIALVSLENSGPIQNIDSNNFFKHFEHFIQ